MDPRRFMAKASGSDGVVEYCKVCSEAAMGLVDGLCGNCR